ncbi:ABC transporter permease [Actinocorallia libanotica]|uniref:ABC transporter permease n=1 Tax=Actinocorallia libanotica TaxID=46162 RepID=A0ABN1RJ98_9ACTN
MNAYRAALHAEFLKARRAGVPALTFAVMALPAGLAALFLFILADPARAQRFGLLGQKAELSGITADWSGLLGFLAQLVAVGDLLLLAFITAWVFGQEHTAGTHRYLLVLPVPRAVTVLAKFTLTTVWAIAANLWLAALVLAAGWALDLPGGRPGVLIEGLSGVAAGTALMILVTTPTAFLASAARSYLPPLAAAVGALVLAQAAAVLGYAHLFPWSIPAAASGLTPTPAGPTSITIAAATALAGVLGTLSWWRGRYADR